MKRLYRVKLTPEGIKTHEETYKGTGTIVDGYLAFCGRIQTYSINEAKNKAYNWDGKVEPYKNPLLEAMTNLSMTQIRENALVYGVEKALIGREAYKDADPTNNERIYHGDVFNDILSEQEGLEGNKCGLDKKAIEQLELLASLITADYVQIICA